MDSLSLLRSKHPRLFASHSGLGSSSRPSSSLQSIPPSPPPQHMSHSSYSEVVEEILDASFGEEDETVYSEDEHQCEDHGHVLSHQIEAMSISAQKQQALRQPQSKIRWPSAPSMSSSSSIPQSKPPPQIAPAAPKTKNVLVWNCKSCQRTCIPIREECRCLCGHRLKEHNQTPSMKNLKCSAPRCKCSHFFYIVAEGAWILRCECKHKHTDHDPADPKHKCLKEKCACKTFFSPWVCNCDCTWSDHTTEVHQLVAKSFAQQEDEQVQRIASAYHLDADISDPSAVKRGYR